MNKKGKLGIIVRRYVLNDKSNKIQFTVEAHAQHEVYSLTIHKTPERYT